MRVGSERHRDGADELHFFPEESDTLFDHAVTSPQTRKTVRGPLNCATLKPGCGCMIPEDDPSETRCAFAAWVAAVAQDLAPSAPKDRDLPQEDQGLDLDPKTDPLSYLLSKKALGSHYPGEMVALPGFYAFHDNPLDQGVWLLSVLYSRAHDPEGDLRIDHRAGYRTEPGVCRVERFFAAGSVEDGDNRAELAYTANHINIRHLVCRTQEDLESLYTRILDNRTPREPREAAQEGKGT